MSVYSPDLTRGVIQALQANGQLKKIKVADQGGSSYSIQQIKDGNIEFTMPYFPYSNGYLAVKSLVNAAQGQGKTPQRFVDVVPPAYGNYRTHLRSRRQNANSFKPEY